MKKIYALILILIMTFSCTACSWHHGDVDAQEEHLMKYVASYYGDAEIISKQTELLDMTTMFMMKDKQDGFEYPMTVMEVYMSDLGFQPTHEGDGRDTTLVLEGQFVLHYVANLIKNKVPHEEYVALLDKHTDIHDVSVMTYDNILANVFSTTIDETAFLVHEFNKEGIKEIADLMQRYDDRNVLKYYIIPIYQAETVNEEVDIKYETDANGDKKPVILGYYDFFFQYILTPDEFDGISMLHDYLLAKDVQNVKIQHIDVGVTPQDMRIEDDFTFLPAASKTGTRIYLMIDGRAHVFFSHLGTKAYTTETNKYGIHEGSFLDIVASERSGGGDILIAYYAFMYPSEYTKLTVFLQEVNEPS